MKNNYTYFSILLLCMLFINFKINAQGFGTTPVNWTLPGGGSIYMGVNSSYYNTYGTAYTNDDDGSQSWTMMDMNGDGKTDLLVYREKISGTIMVPGLPSNPHWKVYLNTGNGFSSTATDWALPGGGSIYMGVNSSYYNTYGTAYTNDDNGSQSWNVMDMNGDAKPDLLVYREMISGNITVPGLPSNPHWKVYLNNGSGFSATATDFALPGGGSIYMGVNSSYYNTYGTVYSNDDNGSQSWNTMDMNGDAKPDLLVYREMISGNITVPGLPSNPHWKVYLNNGSGFSATATDFALPAGGSIYMGVNSSYYNTYGTAYTNDDNGSQSWNTMDMNGDAKPDLLVYREMISGNIIVPGLPSNPHWKVYLNNGSGFSATATDFALPGGGSIYMGVNSSYYNTYGTAYTNDDNGSQSWNTMDMDGDAKPDLLVYREMISGNITVPGLPSNAHWKVYLNNGAGFSSMATDWALPGGGSIYMGVNSSYYNTYGTAYTNDDNGSQSWITMEMNGDAKPDLLVYREMISSTITVPGLPSNPYWKVYLNTAITPGVGFAEQKNDSQNIIAFPNPVNDKITVKLEKDMLGQTYTLTDNFGRLMSSNKLQSKTTHIDVSKLAAGIYFLNFSEQPGKSIKVVKE